jgi:glucosamine--fructose-6-phosphate aminotransferase (isomerizing)
VHNGIIENFRETQGRAFARDGVDVFEFGDGHGGGRPPDHGRDAAAALDTVPAVTGIALDRSSSGAFALAIIFAGQDDLMIGGAAREARSRSGTAKARCTSARDAIALAPFTDRDHLPRGRRLGR